MNAKTNDEVRAVVRDPGFGTTTRPATKRFRQGRKGL